jgi:hypothetical protein
VFASIAPAVALEKNHRRRRCQLTLPQLKTDSLALVAVVALAAFASPALAAMNTDRTLPTAGATCVAQFDALLKKHYGADAKCAKLIKGMLSTADPAKCPDADSAPGSAVQKCMGASEETSKAWEEFVKKCEVMNVANVRDSFFFCWFLGSGRRRAHPALTPPPPPKRQRPQQPTTTAPGRGRGRRRPQALVHARLRHHRGI